MACTKKGWWLSYDDDTHEVMRCCCEKLAPISDTGFMVAPTLEHLHRIASVTGETALAKLLKRFVHNIDVPDGFFYPRITEEQAERALWLDTLPLSVADKFMLSLVPVSTRVPSLQRAWEQWAHALAKKKVCKLHPEPGEMHWRNLQEVEDTCRLYSAYAWIAYRAPEYFPSVALAQELARHRSGSIPSCTRKTPPRARSMTKNSST
ncbi:hypothetical protein LP420_36585 [Massilia sp. B-10]|nr:hypothetical protein LP420_36585 [Massilia sp. B-10]